jgi:hypothetical protein
VGRIFRAFLWMRWRVLVNSLELTGSRDMLERFSIAAGKLGPIMAMILLMPSSIGLFVLGITAGFGTATGSMLVPLEALRYLTFLVLGLTMLGPIVLPTRDGGSVTRLLLLPIPRTALYMAQVAGALADPWIALLVPTVLGVAVGLAVGLSASGALLGLAAGAAFLLFVLGLASFASSVIHLLLRDRRRGDIVMLLLVLVLPILAIAPQMFFSEQRQAGKKMTRAERLARPPSRTERVAKWVLPYVPSEMYYRAAKNAPSTGNAALPLAGLAIAGLGVHLAGYAAYRRVLDMPASQGIRRAGSFGGLWDRVIPGLSAGASAIAFTQLRLALRSPRGRATIGSPLLMPILLAGLGYQRGGLPIPGIQGHYGLTLAALGCFTADADLDEPVRRRQGGIHPRHAVARQHRAAPAGQGGRERAHHRGPDDLLFRTAIAHPARRQRVALDRARAGGDRDLRPPDAGISRAVRRLSQNGRPQQHRSGQ